MSVSDLAIPADGGQPSVGPCAGRPTLNAGCTSRPAAPVPHDRRLSFLSTLRALRENPICAFAEDAYEQPFVSRGRVLLVSNPLAIEHILIGNAANYRKSVQQQRRLTPALGNGLLTAEGEEWRAARRIASPLFSPRAIGALFDDMVVAAQAMCLRWDARLDQELDLAAEFQRLTYEIISRTVFSGELDGERLRIHANMAVYFDTVGRIDLASIFGLPEWLSFASRLKARPALKVFRGIVEKTVAARRGKSPADPGDLLDCLMIATDSLDGVGLGEAEVADNLLTFLAAGHETTGNALSWILYLLMSHPPAMEQARREIEKLGNGAPPRRDQLGDLHFTRAVVNEAMRLYPPAPFIGRQAIGEDVVDDVHVRCGTQVLISPWVVHRHRRLWREPDLFRPERFMDGSAERIPRGAFIPFGLGPRICIGQGFAFQEILVVLGHILPRFDFELRRAQTIFPQARITLRPQNGVAAIIRARKALRSTPRHLIPWRYP